jgi:protein translocase SEC61 complex gamma subunit
VVEEELGGGTEDEGSDETAEEIVEQETAPKPKSHVHPGEPSEGFLAKAWNAQHAIERKWDGFGRGRVARVLRMARKPEPDEFRQSAMIVLVGIAVVGGIGFFVYLLVRGLLERYAPA